MTALAGAESNSIQYLNSKEESKTDVKGAAAHKESQDFLGGDQPNDQVLGRAK